MVTSFLLATTADVLIPSLMVFGALVLRPRANRIINVAPGALYALTVVAGAIGEWSYYILGGVVEVALLAFIVYHAWTRPALAGPVSNPGLTRTIDHVQPTGLQHT
jgi:hypothetical protein